MAQIRLWSGVGARVVMAEKEFRNKGEWIQDVTRSTGDCWGVSAGPWRAKFIASRVSSGDQEIHQMFIELPLMSATVCG